MRRPLGTQSVDTPPFVQRDAFRDLQAIVVTTPIIGKGPIIVKGTAPGSGVTRSLEELASDYKETANNNSIERIVATIDFALEGQPSLCQLLMRARNAIVEALDRKVGLSFDERAFLPFELAAALWWTRMGRPARFHPAPVRGTGVKLTWAVSRIAGAEWIAAVAQGLSPVISTNDFLKSATDALSEKGLEGAVNVIARSPAATKLREFVADKASNRDDIEALAVELFTQGLRAVLHEAASKPKNSKNNNPIYLILLVDAMDETTTESLWARRMQGRFIDTLHRLREAIACHIIIGGRKRLETLVARIGPTQEFALGGLQYVEVEEALAGSNVAQTIIGAIFSKDAPGPIHADALAEAWAAREALPPDSPLAWRLALEMREKKHTHDELSPLLPAPSISPQDVKRLVTGNGNIWFSRDANHVWLTPTMQQAVALVHEGKGK